MAAAASAAPGWSWVGRQRAMGSSGGSVGRCGIVCRGDGMAALRYPWLLPAVWWSHLLPNMEHGTPRRKPSACLGHGGIIAVTAACRVFSRASAVRMQCPDRPLGTAVWRTLLGCKYNGASRSHAHVTERRGSSGDESLLVTGKVSYFLGKLRVTLVRPTPPEGSSGTGERP